MKELMQSLGCTNSDAAKNKLAEVVECGNGKWKSGLRFVGNEKDKVKKTIADYGWDKSKHSGPGGMGVVWVWCTKGEE